MSRRFLIYLIISFAVLDITTAQQKAVEKHSVLSLGLQADYGFIILHSRTIAPIGESYPWGTGLIIAWHYYNKKSWEFCNCYPRLGLSSTYWNFNKPKILGWGLSELFFVEPFFRHFKKFSYSIRAGYGISYTSKPYDETDNPLNLSYSTHIGFPLLLGFNLYYRIEDQWVINLGANYNHISNGGVREPNKGINYPTLGLGVNFLIRKIEFNNRNGQDWSTIFGKEKRFDINIFASLKQLNHDEFKRYPVYGFSLKGSKRVGRLSALTLGFEFLSDESNQEELRRMSRNEVDHKRCGISAGHEFLLGKFVFSQQFGVYIYNPYKADDDVYQRYGLIYRINRTIATGINLKAHRQVADFLDFRLTYIFNF